MAEGRSRRAGEPILRRRDFLALTLKSRRLVQRQLLHSRFPSWGKGDDLYSAWFAILCEWIQPAKISTGNCWFCGARSYGQFPRFPKAEKNKQLLPNMIGTLLQSAKNPKINLRIFSRSFSTKFHLSTAPLWTSSIPSPLLFDIIHPSRNWISQLCSDSPLRNTAWEFIELFPHANDERQNVQLCPGP